MSTRGYRFLFFVNTTYKDATSFLIEIMKDAGVYDEYGNYVSIRSFASIILQKRDNRSLTEANIGKHKDKYWRDEYFDYREVEDYDYRDYGPKK